MEQRERKQNVLFFVSRETSNISQKPQTGKSKNVLQKEANVAYDFAKIPKKKRASKPPISKQIHKTRDFISRTSWQTLGLFYKYSFGHVLCFT